MARLTFGPQRGRPALGRPRHPRVHLTDDFLDRLIAERVPGWRLGVVGGWRHYSHLSAQLHRRIIPAAPVTIERFYRLADALNFSREDVFREVSS